MNDAERAELAEMLSGLLSRIHSLPGDVVAAVMRIDERLRQGSVDRTDLQRLRTIVERVDGKG